MTLNNQPEPTLSLTSANGDWENEPPEATLPEPVAEAPKGQDANNDPDLALRELMNDARGG
jgi:hypothetical protein